MSKKILLLTDSLALPRTFPQECGYEYTWPFLIKKAGYIVHQVSIGGASSTDIVRQLHYQTPFKPDIVVVQVGIVDCAPRFMTRLEQNIARRIPVVGKHIFRAMNRPSVKKIRKISYVGPKLFSKNIEAILEAFKCVKVLFIGIIPASMEYEKILPGISQQVLLYNELIKRHAGDNFVAMEDFDQSGLMSDYHHLNSFGHTQIFDLLYPYIK